MQVLNAVAQFERDLLIVRTQSGLRRVKSEGRVLGHPQHGIPRVAIMSRAAARLM
jgi:DNA invertase Pin-like site-specific DNA recombinase